MERVDRLRGSSDDNQRSRLDWLVSVALVGGKLTIWSEVDSGTEIELHIPGARAYVKSTRPFWYFGKRSAKETDEKETIERE